MLAGEASGGNVWAWCEHGYIPRGAHRLFIVAAHTEEDDMRSTGRLFGGIVLAAALGGVGVAAMRRVRANRSRLETLRRRADAAAQRDAEAAEAGADELLAAW
jgi:hypothetical protein